MPRKLSARNFACNLRSVAASEVKGGVKGRGPFRRSSPSGLEKAMKHRRAARLLRQRRRPSRPFLVFCLWQELPRLMSFSAKSDTIVGGHGNDSVIGGEGNDFLIESQALGQARALMAQRALVQ